MTNSKPILIVTVGLPRSGKSTWANQQGYPVVEPDAIRLALYDAVFIPAMEDFVWFIAKMLVKYHFLRGEHAVILDATNTTAKRRAVWMSDNWETHFQYFDTPADICKSRLTEENQCLVAVIDRMAENFETPHVEEHNSIDPVIINRLAMEEIKRTNDKVDALTSGETK